MKWYGCGQAEPISLEIRPLLAARGIAVPGQTRPAATDPWPLFSPTPPKASHCVSTAPRCRSACPRPTGPAGGRSCPARRNRTPASPPSSAMGTAGCPWARATRPGRTHDVTALRTEDVKDLLRQHPNVKAKVGLRLPGTGPRLSRPGRRPAGKSHPKRRHETQRAEYDMARHTQSSQQICVKHAIAEPKQWRPLQRYIGRREHFEDTILAITRLVRGFGRRDARWVARSRKQLRVGARFSVLLVWAVWLAGVTARAAVGCLTGASQKGQGTDLHVARPFCQSPVIE